MQQKHQKERIDSMGRDFERLFMTITAEPAPSYLCERVLDAVHRERIQRMRTTLVISSLSCIASLSGFVFALRAFFSAGVASGFTSLASLAGTDSSIVAGHFSTFMLSLLESLPGPETTAALFMVAVFLVSLRSLAGAFTSLPRFSRLTTS